MERPFTGPPPPAETNDVPWTSYHPVDATFRDLTGLTGILRRSLQVFLTFAVLALLLELLGMALRVPATEGATSSGSSVLGIGCGKVLLVGAEVLLLPVVGVVFLRWTYLSARNARALGGADIKTTPGWAVGWYFVPIALLWMPYRALKEIFQASHPDFAEGWQEAPRPALLPLWWTLWIVVAYVGQEVSSGAWKGADTPGEILVSSWVTLSFDSLWVPLGIVLLALVAKLQSWQTEKQRRLALASGAQP